MAKIVSSYVPAIGSVAAVSDPATRQVVRSVADAHNTRNGQTDQRFVTRAELNASVADMEAATKALLDATKNATSLASIVKDGYSKGKLQQDLSNGVKGILAGVGSDYRMTIDPDLNIILMAHKDVVYLGTSLNPGPGQSAIGITANGIAMGFNDPTTGAWKDAVAIDANTGNATFLGTVNATAGNFAESITVGNTGVTLGSLAAGSYTKADLEADLSSGVGSILAGFGGDYLMDVNTTNSTIVLTNKYAAYKAVTANPGPGRTAIGITANGIAMGYNDPTSGAWQDAIAISATGDVTILGTLKAGSVIESDAVVNGTSLGTIASNASTAYTTTRSLGALATQNAVDLATQVTGKLSVSGVTGLGALAVLNSINLSTQATGTLSTSRISGLGALATLNQVNAATQVTNLGTLAYANSIAANQIGAGTLAAGVIYAGSISADKITSGTMASGSLNTSGYIRAYGSFTTGVSINGTTNYPIVYGESAFNGSRYPAVLGLATGPSGTGVYAAGTGARARGVYATSDDDAGVYAVSGSGTGVFGQATTTTGRGVVGHNMTGGTALYSQGPFGVSSSALVANLNAQYLNGYSSSSFALASSLSSYATTSYVDSNFLKPGGTFTGRTDSGAYLKVTAGAATVYLKIYV